MRKHAVGGGGFWGREVGELLVHSHHNLMKGVETKVSPTADGEQTPKIRSRCKSSERSGFAGRGLKHH